MKCNWWDYCYNWYWEIVPPLRSHWLFMLWISADLCMLWKACCSPPPLYCPLIAESCTRTQLMTISASREHVALIYGHSEWWVPGWWRVCVCAHVCMQTDRMPQTAQTTWDGYWCAVCLLSRRRRGGQGEVYECVSVRVTQGRWGTASTWPET